MTRALPTAVLVLALAVAGCVFGPPPRYVPARATPQCHPSQYWDGTMCRHKGKGHGARKHDGR